MNLQCHPERSRGANLMNLKWFDFAHHDKLRVFQHPVSAESYIKNNKKARNIILAFIGNPACINKRLRIASLQQDYFLSFFALAAASSAAVQGGTI